MAQNQIEELNSAVLKLTEALTISEKRSQRLERSVRWGVLTAILALCLGLTLLLRPFCLQASQQLAPSQSIEEAIDNLNTRLTGQGSTLGMMGMMLGQMFEIGAYRAMVDASNFPDLSFADCQPGANLSREVEEAKITHQLGFYTKCYFAKAGIKKPTQQDYQAAVMSAVTGVAIDFGVLVARVRDSSDMIRNFVVNNVGTSERLLGGISEQLANLNTSLATVPIMADGVTRMTHQMGVMSADMGSMKHSIGTSMGRMGKWVPW